MDSFNDVWKEVLAGIKTQVSDVMYKMWLAPLNFIKFENDTVVFTINAEFKRGIVIDKFSDMIKKGFEDILGFPVEIDIIVDNLLNNNSSNTENKAEKNEETKSNPYDKFNFDNFIVGKSNTIAFNVSKAVAENPGTNYNPLFVYGRSGLGKTHLMFAIYNQMKANNPDAIIIYTTGESFMNELIEYIQKKTTSEFHEKYRNADALIIDDIQYIEKGQAAQNELFQTFNVLHQADKQVVITSDVHPNELVGFPDRLRSRFVQGIITDIQPPDFDTRKAIIKEKCENHNIKLSETAFDYIANSIKNNIRQLEGIINQIEAFTKYNGKTPNIEEIKELIQKITSCNKSPSEIMKNITERVSSGLSIPLTDIMSKKRNKEIKEARQISMYIIGECLTDVNQTEIGKFFGGFSHSTVINSFNVCKSLMDKNPELKKMIENIIFEVGEELSEK